MSGWVTVCSRLYRRAARAFPYEFRAVCGDGLEQLGEDVVPLVWQQQGTVGMIRLFADLAMRLPYEYLSTWISKAKELTMTNDLFEGTWTAKGEDAQWDVPGNAKPQQACVRFEATDTGYLMVAYGIVDGKAVAERPQAISTDGRRRPIVDLNGRPIPGVPPGAVAFGSRSDSQTLEVGAEVDGRVLSAATYKVSADGKTLTATNEGVGLKGPYKNVWVFERVVPDPYLPQG
jgi:hypothetical protein